MYTSYSKSTELLRRNTFLLSGVCCSRWRGRGSCTVWACPVRSHNQASQPLTPAIISDPLCSASPPSQRPSRGETTHTHACFTHHTIHYPCLTTHYYDFCMPWISFLNPNFYWLTLLPADLNFILFLLIFFLSFTSHSLSFLCMFSFSLLLCLPTSPSSPCLVCVVGRGCISSGSTRSLIRARRAPDWCLYAAGAPVSPNWSPGAARPSPNKSSRKRERERERDRGGSGRKIETQRELEKESRMKERKVKIMC